MRASVTPAETATARRLLPDAAWPLFAAMPVADRRHALDVVGRLMAARADDPDVLAAALLHDGAKGHRMRLWHRVAGVLLEALAPRQLQRLASSDPQSWRYPFYLYSTMPSSRPRPRAERAAPPARLPSFVAPRRRPIVAGGRLRLRRRGILSAMPLQPIPIEVEPQPFELRLGGFAGPLDLLLQLIESRQLDVLTVPLAAMADAYVERLANHPVPADELADFVAIASQLILLKSRRLLPGDALPAGLLPEDEPDEDELRRRLVEYRALRDAARVLGEWDMARPAYRREPREADLPEAPVEPIPTSLLSDALERLAAIPEPARHRRRSWRGR